MNIFRKHIKKGYFRNAVGGTSVIGIKGQGYYPNSVGITIHGLAAESGFYKGQNVTYENGDLIISGPISIIIDSNMGSPMDNTCTLVVRYTEKEIGLVNWGRVYPTPASAAQISAPAPVEIISAPQPVSPVIAPAPAYTPTTTVNGPLKVDHYDVVIEADGTSRMVYNPIVATPSIDARGNISFGPLPEVPTTARVLEDRRPEEVKAAEIKAELIPQISTPAAQEPLENTSGMILPKVEPMLTDAPSKKTNYASSVILIALLGGVLLFGFKAK